jgi:hypothetical protein
VIDHAADLGIHALDHRRVRFHRGNIFRLTFRRQFSPRREIGREFRRRRVGRDQTQLLQPRKTPVADDVVAFVGPSAQRAAAMDTHGAADCLGIDLARGGYAAKVLS